MILGVLYILLWATCVYYMVTALARHWIYEIYLQSSWGQAKWWLTDCLQCCVGSDKESLPLRYHQASEPWLGDNNPLMSPGLVITL